MSTLSTDPLISLALRIARLETKLFHLAGKHDQKSHAPGGGPLADLSNAQRKKLNKIGEPVFQRVSADVSKVDGHARVTYWLSDRVFREIGLTKRGKVTSDTGTSFVE